MLIRTPLSKPNPLRDALNHAYRMDETACLNQLIAEATLPQAAVKQIQLLTEKIVVVTRNYMKNANKIDSLLHKYDLSTEEGIALMCLAEALLRIPDTTTIDKFIADKISTGNWKNHLNNENSLFLNAATWSLLMTGKVYGPTLNDEKTMTNAIKRAASRIGASMVRPVIMQMMKTVGNQFVMGENITDALSRAQELITMGYRFSFDMLGESARTDQDALNYYQAYEKAIDAIGQEAQHENSAENQGISIKLSALYPRYEYVHREEALAAITPLLLTLCTRAKKYNIGLTVDAEEADRLDLSLDIFATVYADSALQGWHGFGLAVQAYQKRASFVIDWLASLVKEHHKRIMVRLVKGAYWDAEIKTSQVQGFSDYPVFTRKNSTDVSYLACAKKLLSMPDYFYPQFGTHNAYTVAAILTMANKNAKFEFQCLHGMGRPLYDQIVTGNDSNKRACRIYAPVGTHKDLLGYLVRRLLENGANSSFINRLANQDIPLEKILQDPVARIAGLASKSHPHIPAPSAIYRLWKNSTAPDLSNVNELAALKTEMDADSKINWRAGSLVNGKLHEINSPAMQLSPSTRKIIGHATFATDELVAAALTTASTTGKEWAKVSLEERATTIEHAADLLQQALPRLVTILVQEGGKCVQDSIAEVREAIDYCRYYAMRARRDLAPETLPGPTGEFDGLYFHPRGIIVCISPWNFPLAIFIGQLIAALLAGNAVIAKPAEQTPLIAFATIRLLHEAGIPVDTLQLLIGDGHIGAQLVKDPRVAGVMFTGSTDTAKSIERALAARSGPIAMLIAETGGLNAMIVDSSALAEQTVLDIAQSAFNSAGQRCSALRVLFVQEEIAPKILTMLSGYMAKLSVGDPQLIATDIGPIIDTEQLQKLLDHKTKLEKIGKFIAAVPMNEQLPGYYFAPCAYEISDLSFLKEEVFGPILHVIRYKANQLDNVLTAIEKTGYGLTLGIQSRIDATVQYILNRMPVGNVYINRNMIGAVVGVQPFGGEGLSGTGPKAGGPQYLLRLCTERALANNITAVGGNARLVSLLEDD